jgi:THO complex subunit 1
LSRSQNTVFCGRILLFLAKFFPFSERSGLNVISEFNLENTTVFSTDEFDVATNDVAVMDVDEDDSPEAKKIKIEDDEKK